MMKSQEIQTKLTEGAIPKELIRCGYKRDLVYEVSRRVEDHSNCFSYNMPYGT